MSRYSTKMLSERLGLKAGQRLYFEGAPLVYLDALGTSPAGVRFLEYPVGPIDFIHLFAREPHTIADRMPRLAEQLAPRGMLWIAWPKRAVLRRAAMDEEALRTIAAACGLTCAKTCELTDEWVGCKLVRRKKGRVRPAGASVLAGNP
ncbi:DUF3052 family protein [Cohnella sp. 56]|uniref:DUF3052 family protein n=1 Tax=Cohnella sp. 56 TaxID=3113722 RepID=UPI0030E7E66E